MFAFLGFAAMMCQLLNRSCKVCKPGEGSLLGKDTQLQKTSSMSLVTNFCIILTLKMLFHVLTGLCHGHPYGNLVKP